MSLIRSCFKRIGKFVLPLFEVRLSDRLDAYLMEIQEEVDAFAESDIYPDDTLSCAEAQYSYNHFQTALAKNKRLLSSLESSTELQGTQRNKYYWRVLDIQWEVLECVEFILQKKASHFTQETHAAFKRDRREALGKLLLIITREETRDEAFQTGLRQTLAKLYLYCEEAGLQTELGQIKLAIQLTLGRPVRVMQFYRSELVPYHFAPARMIKEALNAAKNCYMKIIEPRRLLETLPFLKANTQFLHFLVNSPTPCLKKLHVQLELFSPTKAPLDYSELMACIEAFNSMSSEALQLLPALMLKNLILFYINPLVLKEALALFLKDAAFLEYCQKCSPYNPSLYQQLAVKCTQRKAEVKITQDLLQIYIFTTRRLQLCFNEEPHEDLGPIYKEAKKGEEQGRHRLLACSSPLPIASGGDKESKSPVTPPGEKALAFEVKRAAPKRPQKVAPATAGVMGAGAVSTSLLPPPQKASRAAGKKPTLPFKKSDLQEAIQRKQLAAAQRLAERKSERVEIPARERLATREETRRKKAITTLNEANRLRRIAQAEQRKKDILSTLEEYKITLPKEPELKPAALRYARQIARMDLAAIHGGSVRDAIKASFLLEKVVERKEEAKEEAKGEAKEGKMEGEVEDCDVDIMIDLNAKTEVHFPKTDFKLICHGKNIITVAPEVIDPHCSVQMIRKFDLNNRNTIAKIASLCDFTINSFLARYDETTGKIHFYSLLGKRALKDLRENRLVVAHPKGVAALFTENPICMLRALRFAIEKKYLPTADIYPAIKTHAAELLKLEPQIINVHLTKLLMHGKASPYLRSEAFQQVLATLFPQFSAIKPISRNALFARVDKLASRKTIPLTVLYAALLVAQCAPSISSDKLVSAMELAYQQNKLIQLAFSRMSPVTRGLIFTNAISDFSFLIKKPGPLPASDPAPMHSRPAMSAS